MTDAEVRALIVRANSAGHESLAEYAAALEAELDKARTAQCYGCGRFISGPGGGLCSDCQYAVDRKVEGMWG